MNISNLPILLTASISTHGMNGACFSDKEREEMYLSALTFYLKAMPDNLFVFAENSGYDLDDFKSQLPPPHTDCAGKIEFISVPHSLCDLSKGKGYNEMILIQYAIQHSDFIKKEGAFFKATGRYPVYNLSLFVDKAQKALNSDYELYCDIKDHKLYDFLRLGWCGHSFECRLFGCTTEFFMVNFWSHANKCNDEEGRFLESVLYDATKSFQGKIVDRFPREPHLGGMAGHQMNAVIFTQAHDDHKAKLKRIIGNGIRIFTPWFKF